MDYATLPAPLQRFLGSAMDPFTVRLLARSDLEIASEAAWRAVGQWDCNERDSWAAWRALSDIAAGIPSSPPAWGREEYERYRGLR